MKKLIVSLASAFLLTAGIILPKLSYAQCTPPAITIQPVDTAACANGNTFFKVTASDATSYQWQEKSVTGWPTVGTAGFSAGEAEYTNLVINGGTPYVAYSDFGNSQKVTVMKFNGTAWVTVGAAGFSAGQADYISLAFDGSTPYVAYEDYANSKKITVMKFDGTNWITVGTAGFSADQVLYTSLAFSGSTPYVVYQDVANSFGATVMKFDGTNWVTVGTAGFSGGEADYTSLAFNGNTPFVAYQDHGVADQATVMKFDGTNWVTVGTGGFSAGKAINTSLAFNGSTPYVSYCDYANSFKTTVMKFNGSSWETVGAAVSSGSSFDKSPLAFNNGIPYVAYSDGGSSKATVKEFDGASWVTVGTAKFSANSASYTSLAFDGSTPYVAYSDGANSYKATVMKFQQWIDLSGETGSTLNLTNVPQANDGKIYRVVAVGGCAPNAESNEVNLWVNVLPGAPSGAASQAVCSNGTVANLTTTTGNSIQWYAASTGGSALSSATALVNSATYYATQNTNGCESGTRLPVSVTFSTAPWGMDSVTTLFNYTGALQTYTVPASITSIRAEVSGAKGGNGNPGTTAGPNGPIVVPGGTGGSGAMVQGTIAVTPASVLNIYVGGINSISGGPFDAAASNSGGASGLFLGADSLIISAGGGAGGDAIASPGPNGGAGGTGSTTKHSGTNASGFTPGAGGVNFIKGTVTGSSTANGANAGNGTVRITYYTKVSLTTSLSDNNVCNGTNVTLKSNIDPGSGYTAINWQFSNNGGASFTNMGGGSTPTRTINASNTINNNQYRALFNYGQGCSIASAPVTLTVNPNLPASVSIGASSTTVCAGTSVTFTATPTNGGTTPAYQWKVNGSNAGTNLSTFTSSALNNGDVVTVVMTSNATPCLNSSPATSNSINMTVNPNLTASVGIVASASTICAGTSVTFTATPAGGGTTPAYQWKVNGNNAGSNSATFTSSTLNNNDVVTVDMTSNASPCLIGSPATSNAITVTVNVPTAPTGTAAQTFCNSGTVTDLTAAGTSIKWYAAATGGSALVGTAALTSTTYYASQTVSGCESAIRFAVTATINVPSAPTGSAAQSFCNSGTVADLTATGASIKWYASATGGSALLGTAALTSTTYYASQTVSSCESAIRFAVTTTINVPSAPTGSAAQSFCNSGTVADLTATGSSIQWYGASTGGAALTGTTALTDGTIYYASQTLSGCEGATRFAVTVSINVPSAPTGNAAQSFCNSGKISDLIAIGSAIKWYAASTGGSALSGTTALATTTYYASQTVGGCESVARFAITVTVKPLPTVSIVYTGDTICLSSASFTLTIGSPAGGVYSGAGVSGNTFNPATAGIGTHNIIYTYTNNGCSNSDTATLSIKDCTTGIAIVNNSLEFNVYPNPGKGNVTISTNVKDAMLIVRNVLGDEVMNMPVVSDKQSVDLSQLSDGMYYMIVKNNANTLLKRIVIQK